VLVRWVVQVVMEDVQIIELIICDRKLRAVDILKNSRSRFNQKCQHHGNEHAV
jgi:predicted RNA-binding protein